ncbi:MAG: hypothetical protein ACK4S2_11135 [Gemmobacter sp.]|uniref:hypothetical protein n=1 Tax=Gemmobacter sp. TaxID=1898957 RepID=UPI00391A2FD4
MILASLLSGILAGITGFAAALIAGHGLPVALGLYVLAGMVGVAVTLGLMTLRGLVRQPRVASAEGAIVARAILATHRG